MVKMASGMNHRRVRLATTNDDNNDVAQHGGHPANRELKHVQFWDADSNRKRAVFTFNLPTQNHIHIAKYHFPIRNE